MKFLLILVILAIVVLIVKAMSSNTAQPSEKDSKAISEALNYIESVKNMFDCDSILQKGETLGCFQIIPIDESKEMYMNASCRLMLMLLMYDEDDWHFQIVNSAAERNSSVFKACFHVETVTDNKQYVAYSVCRFTSNYKSFMRHLYSEVDKRYPGKFEFDGSRVMSKAQYGESLF